MGQRWRRGVQVAAALSVLVGPAVAQSPPKNPLTADQIITALKPTGAIKSGSRGIRPAPVPAAADAATNPAVRTAAAPTATTVWARSPSVDLNVHFEFGSAELTFEATRALDELGRALTSQALAGYRFRIEGHTDTVGTEDFNRNLSDQRASTVARYLEKKFAVGAARLETVGLGDGDLLVPTPPQTPEMRNRRVHVVNLGA